MMDIEPDPNRAPSDLERRQAALEKTLAKYQRRVLDFVDADCGRMLRFHLLAMGRRPPTVRPYRSARGAARRLTEMGGFAAILDGMNLERIPYSRMLPGDVAVMEGEGGMDAVVICLGFKVCGWIEGTEEMVNITPIDIKQAWRV